MYRDWLAGEQAELDATVGKAEDAREEHAEKIALTLDLADHVEDETAELVEDQRDVMRWAAEAFGGPEALDRWISKQGDADDQRDALTELAELYVSGDGAIEDADDSEPTEADNIAFSDFVGGAIGEEGIAQLNTLPDAEYDEAIADLSEAFLAAHPEHDDDFEDEDGEEFAGGGWASI